MSTTGWVLVAIAAAVAMWAVAAHNGLVQRRNRINNAFGQIDVQLKRRYDLVPNLVDVAKRYLAHEAATLEAVIRARGAAVAAAEGARSAPASAAAVSALSQAEEALGGSLGRLDAAARGGWLESHPPLEERIRRVYGHPMPGLPLKPPARAA